MIAALLPVAFWPQIETLAIVAAVSLGAYVLWSVGIQVVNDDVRGGNVEETRHVVGRLP